MTLKYMEEEKLYTAWYIYRSAYWNAGDSDQTTLSGRK